MQKWYWFGRSDRSISITATDIINYGDKDEFFERTPHTAKVGIRIRELTKVSYNPGSATLSLSVHGT